MITWRYEISLLMLNNNYSSTLEGKFCISTWLPNQQYLFHLNSVVEQQLLCALLLEFLD